MNVAKVIGVGMGLVAVAVFGLVLADDGLGLQRAEAVSHSAYLVSLPTAYPDDREPNVFCNNTDSSCYVAPETFSNVVKERLELSFTATAVAAGTAMDDNGVIPFTARDGWAYYAIWSSSPLRDVKVTLQGVAAASSVAAHFNTAPTRLVAGDTNGYLYVARKDIAVLGLDGDTNVLTPPYTDFNGTCSTGGHTDRAACEAASGTYTPPDWPTPTMEDSRQVLSLPMVLAGTLFAPGLSLEYPRGAVSFVKREYPVPGMTTVLKFAPLFLALGLIATMFGISRRG